MHKCMLLYSSYLDNTAGCPRHVKASIKAEGQCEY